MKSTRVVKTVGKEKEKENHPYHIFLLVGVERILQWIRHEWRESRERRVLGQSHEIQFCKNTHRVMKKRKARLARILPSPST